MVKAFSSPAFFHNWQNWTPPPPPPLSFHPKLTSHKSEISQWLLLLWGEIPKKRGLEKAKGEPCHGMKCKRDSVCLEITSPGMNCFKSALFQGKTKKAFFGQRLALMQVRRVSCPEGRHYLKITFFHENNSQWEGGSAGSVRAPCGKGGSWFTFCF